MDLGLTGQRAVVVGGARGIGLAIAREFVREGARVAILDLSAGVPEVAAAIDPSTVGLVVDVADERAVWQVAERILDRLGGWDHVVHAAAIGSGKFGMPFWNLDPADWDRVLQVNVRGAVNVAHVFAPALVAQRHGSLLFLGSVAGQIGSPTDPPYSASKAALINLAQCAARDLAPHGVRVNTLNPGMVRTDLNRSVWASWNALRPEGERLEFEAWAAEKIARLVPLNRWQEPEDLAGMAVFLASERGRNITGQTINVDGGYVMHW